MALPGNKNFSDYDNYVTDLNPTTSAQAQDYFRNQAELLKAVIDCDFWQPETVYQPGDVVKSDSMPNGTEAVMVATKASVTSNVEPQWGAVGGANISDGACFWKLRWSHFSKNIATQAEAEAGTDNTTVMTPLRTAQEIEAKALSKNANIPISQGGTGATTAKKALENLGGFPLSGGTLTGNTTINNFQPTIFLEPTTGQGARTSILKNANTNGDYGTFIFDGLADGTRDCIVLSRNAFTLAEKVRLRVEDTNGATTLYKILGEHNVADYIIKRYRNGSEWYEVYKSGKIRQGGVFNGSAGYGTVTLLKPFTTTDYLVFHNGTEVSERDLTAIDVHKRTTTSFEYNFWGTHTIMWVAEGV